MRRVWEASEPGDSTAMSSKELPPFDDRLYALVDTETDGYFFPLLLFAPNSMMISGLSVFCPSRGVCGRPLEEDGRRCCTTYVPAPVGVGGLMGDGVSLRVLSAPFFG